MYESAPTAARLTTENIEYCGHPCPTQISVLPPHLLQDVAEHLVVGRWRGLVSVQLSRRKREYPSINPASRRQNRQKSNTVCGPCPFGYAPNGAVHEDLNNIQHNSGRSKWRVAVSQVPAWHRCGIVPVTKGDRFWAGVARDLVVWDFITSPRPSERESLPDNPVAHHEQPKDSSQYGTRPYKMQGSWDHLLWRFRGTQHTRLAAPRGRLEKQ